MNTPRHQSASARGGRRGAMGRPVPWQWAGPAGMPALAFTTTAYTPAICNISLMNGYQVSQLSGEKCIKTEKARAVCNINLEE